MEAAKSRSSRGVPALLSLYPDQAIRAWSAVHTTKRMYVEKNGRENSARTSAKPARVDAECARRFFIHYLRV